MRDVQLRLCSELAEVPCTVFGLSAWVTLKFLALSSVAKGQIVATTVGIKPLLSLSTELSAKNLKIAAQTSVHHLPVHQLGNAIRKFVFVYHAQLKQVS
jgi:hypothetical protein